MQRETKQIYEFGVFRLDTAQRLLLRGGATVPLTPKNFDLLLALVESHGRVLEKEALMKMVWPDTFVEEINLSKGIFLLRKTLGDGYIETLPKRGYRFIAETHTGGETEAVIEDLSVPPQTIEASSRPNWKRALALGAVVIFAIASWLLFRGGAKPRISSLVVLPFMNLSASPDDEYFSDGLTEELIHALTGIDGLRVVARTSAFRFKGKPVDVREIGRTLNADAVIEGSVRRDQSRIRVTVQLNSARDGYHFWSKTFERENAGIFAVQEEIAQAVMRTVEQQSGSRPVRPTVRAGARNLEAYNLYLRGEYLRQRSDLLDQGFTLIQQATDIDPSFAAAWADQAICYNLMAIEGKKYPKDAYPRAIEAAQRALTLDPNLASAHEILGTVHLFYNHDWVSSKRELDTAVALDPDDAETHHALSHYWVTVGNLKLAREESLRAQSCDPLNVSIASHQAFVWEEGGRYAEAVAAAEEALRLDPRHVGPWYYMQVAYERWGKLREAIATRRRAGWEDPPTDTLERALAERGPSGYWRVLAEAEEKRYRKFPTGELGLARIYTFLGQTDRALDWLKLGIENRDPFIVNMKYEPTFATMRNDPRFIALVKTASIP